MEAHKKIEASQVVEFLLIEQHLEKIEEWMKKKVGDFEIIENYQTFIRFKVKSSVSVGDIFKNF